MAAIRQRIQERRQDDFERLQYDRWRRDEVTDQSERLASPMVNTFDYRLENGALVTDLGEPLRPVFEDGYNVAQMQAALDPRWQFESVRRGIEMDEFVGIEEYANQLGEGVRMTSLSLDGSDYEAMRAIAESLGYRLPMDYPGSEAILASRMWTPEGLVVLSPIPDAVRYDGVEINGYDKKRLKLLVRIVTASGQPELEHEALIDRIRSRYDDVLTARTGQKHYAGRVQMSNQDARSFVESQGDLLDAHMSIVNKIFNATTDKAERMRQMAPHRYNFAAALDDRLHGRTVSSLGDSGENARAEGKTFDGDCPTVETATTAGEQAGRLGYHAERWSKGVCRNCERVTSVWRVEDGGCNVCRNCAGAHSMHGDAGLARERQKANAEREKLQRRQALEQKIGAVTARQTVKFMPPEPKETPQYMERLGIGGTVKEQIRA